MYTFGITTRELFNTSAHLVLADVAALLPDVPKKFIRNTTDRELIRLVGLSDPRQYTFRNTVELQGIYLGSTGGSSFAIARLIGAAMAHRVEQRIIARTIGTDQDMRVMVYRFTVEKLKPGEGTRESISLISPKFCPVADVPEALKSYWADEPGEVRSLPADEIIETIVRRYKAWEASIG